MEQRKDYILNRWVYLASERKKRPKEFRAEEVKDKSSVCYFCEGNEHMTPPEIGRLEEGGRWLLRWFPNKFPAVRPEGNPIIRTSNMFFTFSDAFGSHEVIADTRPHDKQLWDMPCEHIKKLIYVIKERVNVLSSMENTSYVIVFKNNKREAGASLSHSHTQVVSINHVPPLVREEVEACRKFSSCPYCGIVSIEKGSLRRCFENRTFAAFTPYASRFNFEIWVFPKRHAQDFNSFTDDEFTDLAGILSNVLAKLKELNAPYNIHFHYSPKGENLHFHLEITPRFAVWAGFEFCSNDTINSVSPEDAAKFYRGEE